MCTRFYNTKVIKSSITEVYEYAEPIAYDYKNTSSENINRISFQDATPEMKKERIERMQKRYLNERWTICRLIDVNFDNSTSFLTLTFKENVQDIEDSNYEFMKFIKRLNYKIYKTKKAILKYLAVWEQQKRGAIHYHVMLFSVPKIPYKELTELWGFGSVNIQKVDADSKENRGRYLSKYFAKNLDDPQFLIKFMGKKRFFTSKNLIKPNITVKYLEKKIEFNESQILFQKEYFGKKKVGDEWFTYPIRYTKLSEKK
ncbi:Rep protein [Psychrobacillus psychrodurans]|uniref:rolling circle replication-associated protein n=1 Tax=Psychrobacillus psychrodurans TaxID=126157 RepID=UPI001F4DA15D|nr:Rep protein [Psychrobacillus psychrodurans]MCK1998140.1 Rep protein [Psychrobacillus psychrodurans]